MKDLLLIGSEGYIGSRLYADLNTKYNIRGIDVGWFNQSQADSERIDFKNIDNFCKFDVIILLAGHSSVKMCDGDITSSWLNNVENFKRILSKIDASQLFIYASSGSVYGTSNVTSEDSILPPDSHNNYDLTKKYIDEISLEYISKGFNIVGLRFGTVNGWSPRLRNDIMINSMISSILHKNLLHASNLDVNRPILGISDLVRAIETIIDEPKSGIYNLCSFNATVGDISSTVSALTGTSIVQNSTASSYDFKMSANKFSREYNFAFNDTVATIVKELEVPFKESNRNVFIPYQ